MNQETESSTNNKPIDIPMSDLEKLEIYEQSKLQAKAITESYMFKDEVLPPEGEKSLELLEQFFIATAEQLVLMLPGNFYSQECMRQFERSFSLAKKSIHAHSFNIRKQKEAHDKQRTANAGNGTSDPRQSSGASPAKESPVLSAVASERESDQGGGEVI